MKITDEMVERALVSWFGDKRVATDADFVDMRACLEAALADDRRTLRLREEECNFLSNAVLTFREDYGHLWRGETKAVASSVEAALADVTPESET